MPASPPPTFEPAEVELIRERLTAWFEEAARDLPWRQTKDPYAIWVSEVMLQQTRVDTATGYYRRWMERFPTVDTLAMADREAVLESWAGLGYYSRARNLHAAAQVVCDRFAGEVPASVEQLRSLPGVGEYTAGAVASIAFGRPEPAVDGNVRRVLARLRDLPRPAPRVLRSLAKQLVPEGNPGAFNEALMELGAMICVPRVPACDACPVGPVCTARALGTVDDRPLRTPSRRPRAESIEVVVIARMGSHVGADAHPGAHEAGRRPDPHPGPPPGQRPPSDPSVLLVRNPDDGLLGGMWGLPGVADIPPENLEVVSPLPVVRHRFTHIDAVYVPRLAIWSAGAPPSPSPTAVRWIAQAELPVAALPVGVRKILESAFDVLDRARRKARLTAER